MIMFRQIGIFISLLICSPIEAQTTDAIALGYYKFYENGKVGLRDSLGKIILTAKYNDIMSLDYSYSAKYKPLLHGIIKASVGKYIDNTETHWKIFNTKGDPLSDAGYSYVGLITQNLLKVGKGSMKDIGHNEHYGLMNFKGELIIPIEYRSLDRFHVDTASNTASNTALFTVQLNSKNREFKIIDIRGKAINSDIYEDVNPYGLLHKAKMKGKYGYLSNEGKMVIPFIYDELYGFRNGRGIAVKDKKFGIIDEKGETIVSFDYQNIRFLFEHRRFGELYISTQKGLWGIIDSSGTVLLSHKYLYIDPFQLYIGVRPEMNQFLVKNTENKVGVIDLSTQKYIIQPDYNFLKKELDQRQQMVLLSQKGDKFGIIDSSGQVKTAFEYQSIQRLEGSAELLFSARKGEYYGVIDGLTGETVYPFVYNYVQTMSSYPREYQLQLKLKDSIVYTFIDGKGEAIRSQKQPNTNFGNSQIVVIRNGQKKYAWCNFEGDTITGFYDVIQNFQSGYSLCVSAKKLGLLNREGKLLLPCVYDDIRIPSESQCKYMGNTYFAVKIEDKWGLVNEENEVTVKHAHKDVQDAWKNWKAQ